jgi:hypothetical protein
VVESFIPCFICLLRQCAETSGAVEDTGGKPGPKLTFVDVFITILTLGLLSTAAGIAAGAVLQTLTHYGIISLDQSALTDPRPYWIPGIPVGAALAAPIAFAELLSILGWPTASTLSAYGSQPRQSPSLPVGLSTQASDWFLLRWLLKSLLSLAVLFLRPFLAVEVASRVIDPLNAELIRKYCVHLVG